MGKCVFPDVDVALQIVKLFRVLSSKNKDYIEAVQKTVQFTAEEQEIMKIPLDDLNDKQKTLAVKVKEKEILFNENLSKLGEKEIKIKIPKFKKEQLPLDKINLGNLEIIERYMVIK
jgi:hypothetical protein